VNKPAPIWGREVNIGGKKSMEMVIEVIIPIIKAAVTGIGAMIVGPFLLDRWKSRKVRFCYHSLISHFDKICRSLGSGTFISADRETYFETDSNIESLIKLDQNTPSTNEGGPYWGLRNRFEFRTALNTSRIQAGLETGNFYFSRHFLNNKCGELLVVLTVKKNTATIQAFDKGEWIFPKNKQKSKLQHRLRRIKIKFFGYDRPDYSIMLV
jgi:hypothetical protein